MTPAGLPQPEGMALGADGVRPMYQHMMDMARVYGDLFGVISYGERVVVLNSPELLREVLVEKGEAPLGRIPFGNTPHVNSLRLGIVKECSRTVYCTTAYQKLLASVPNKLTNVDGVNA